MFNKTLIVIFAIIAAFLLGFAANVPNSNNTLLPIVSAGNKCPTTEAQLEAALTDVNDVYTDNDIAKTLMFFSYWVQDHAHIYYNNTADENLTLDVDHNLTFMNANQLTFNMDDTGVYDTPLQPAMRARLLVNQMIPSGIWTRVQLAVLDFDTQNNFAVSGFSCTKPGYYSLTYGVKIFDLADRDLFMSTIWINGAQAAATCESTASTFGLTDLAHSGADIQYLTVLDLVELYVYQTSGFNKWLSANSEDTYLAIYKLG